MRQITFVQQLETADCGAACLAMALDFLGHSLTLPEAREATGAGWRDGISAAEIIRGAARYGVIGRPVALDVEQFELLPRGSVLHWGFDHYVVFNRTSRRGLHVVDPACGPRLVPHDKVSELFTGVAITFLPSAEFVPRRAPRMRSLTRMLHLRDHAAPFTRVLISSVVLRGLALFLPLLTSIIVDRVIPDSNRGLFLILTFSAIGVLLLQAVMQLLRARFLVELRTDIDLRLSLGFIDHLASLPFEFFQRHSGGDLVARANSTAAIRDILASGVLSGTIDSALVLMYATLIFASSVEMGAIVLACGGLYVAIFLASRRRVRNLASEQLEASARSQSHLIEMVHGIETLKCSSSEAFSVQRWSNLYVNELNLSVASGRLNATVDAARSLVTTSAPVLLLLYGAHDVVEGRIQLGQMLALNSLAIGFWAPLAALLENAFHLQILGSYAERMDDVMAAEVERADGDALPPARERDVACEHLSYRYTPSGPLVVRDVSFQVERGQAVAVVGPSGCGKTTLAKLLCGLVTPTSGRVLWDGTELANLDPRRLRADISVVPQAPTLFSGSIRSAISMLDPSAGMDAVVAAARLACIDADIRRMPMGYNTIISDGGSSLSGGQRQRIALARALLRKPSVLILDEATSALDADTEARVVANLRGLACTRIMIAHRLSSIQTADQILVMDNGELVERGSHHDLIKLRGVYHGLVARQLEGDSH